MSATLDAPVGADAPGQAPRPRGTNPLWRVLRPLASLQLTVALFALSMVLVFFGTLAQIDKGFWTVVEQYFWSAYVWIPFQLLAEFGKKFFELMGKFGPGYGLTATLIGQVAMFRNLGGDSAAIGQALAIALIGTLYGCLITNVMCGPIADKLHLRSAEEQFAKQIIITGIKSIQAGDNPRIVEMKLQSFLSERELAVARSAARGLANKQIAAELGIAASTVGVHLSVALRKLRLPGRRALASWF